MHILFLSNYWPPEIGAPSHLAYELGETLVQVGHKVSVVTGFPRYNVATIPPEYHGRYLYEEVMGGMRVLRISAFHAHGTSKVRRGLGHLLIAPLLAWRARAMSQADVVYTVSPPLPLGLAAWITAARLGSSFVFGVQDLFPQSAIDLGTMRNPLIIQFFEWMERLVYGKAGAITVHSAGNRDHILAKGGEPTRVHILPNWVDTSVIKPGERYNGFRHEFGVGNEFVVGFAGTMGWSQGLDVVVEAARQLVNESDILFMLVGDGAERERLVRQAEGLPNVRFAPMQPKERYPQVLAAMDTCLVVLRPEVATPVVPSKLLTIMAAGRPVLASMPVHGDAPGIVRDAECGIIAPAGDAQQLAEAILNIKQNANLAGRMGENGRRYAEIHFSRPACVHQFEEVFEQVIRR